MGLVYGISCMSLGRSVMVSLRLLPKIIVSFFSYRGGPSASAVTLWVLRILCLHTWILTCVCVQLCWAEMFNCWLCVRCAGMPRRSFTCCIIFSKIWFFSLPDSPGKQNCFCFCLINIYTDSLWKVDNWGVWVCVCAEAAVTKKKSKCDSIFWRVFSRPWVCQKISVSRFRRSFNYSNFVFNSTLLWCDVAMCVRLCRSEGWAGGRPMELSGMWQRVLWRLLYVAA